MASKYMEMQTTITMRYLYTLNRITKMKKKSYRASGWETEILVLH